MKFRLRSLATKETTKLEIPDSSTLADLKALIASSLGTSSSPIPSKAIHLSLNGKDELVAPSPGASLPSLGLANGDILYFSFVSSPNPQQSLNLASDMKENDESSNLAPIPLAESLILPPVTLDSFDQHQSLKVTAESSNLAPISLAENPIPMVENPAALESKLPEKSVPDDQEVSMEVDWEPIAAAESLSIPVYLKRVMEAEKREAESLLGRLVVVVHASFLESGFVVSSGGGGGGGCRSQLPEGWGTSAATRLSVQYTVPDLVATVQENDVEVVTLNFSVIGNYAIVYGYSSGNSVAYRVRFDLSKLATLLSLDMCSLNEREAKEVFELWKVVKDGLSLPLLIDICHKNGMPLPSCFMSLPTDLKIKILGLVHGVDIARASCTCSELWYLSSSEELWKRKFEEEIGMWDEKKITGRNWKERYVNYWSRKNFVEKVSRRQRVFGFPGVFPGGPAGPFPIAPLRFPVIGGDYDLFPAVPIGLHPDLFPVAPRVGIPRRAAQRTFSPECNLDGTSAEFTGY